MSLFRAVAVGTVLGVTAAAFSASAPALSYGAGPKGSVLFFPYLKNFQERTTIRITNGGPDTVSVQIIRVCAGIVSSLNTGNCPTGAFTEELTPNETFNYIVPAISSPTTADCTQGYVVAYAESRLYNELFGEFSIERVLGSGNRMGGAPAIAIKGVSAGANGSVLMFDGVKLEKVGTELESPIRTTFINLASRGSKFFLGSFSANGGINPVTTVSFDVYPENEVPSRSGSLTFVCARWFDPKANGIAQLLSGGGGLSTNFGSMKWESVSNSGGAQNGIFGYWMREEGGGKRTIEPMWIGDETASTSAIFRY